MAAVLPLAEHELEFLERLNGSGDIAPEVLTEVPSDAGDHPGPPGPQVEGAQRESPRKPEKIQQRSSNLGPPSSRQASDDWTKLPALNGAHPLGLQDTLGGHSIGGSELHFPRETSNLAREGNDRKLAQ